MALTSLILSSGTLETSLTVLNANVINFNDITATVGDPVILLQATSTNTTGPAITYESTNTDVGSVIGNMLTIVGKGTTNIKASQAVDSDYAEADKTIVLTVLEFNTLTYTPLLKYVNETFTPQPIGQNNTNPIRYTSSNDNIAVVTNGQVTPQAAGTVTLTAIQDASSTVSGKIVEISLTVDTLGFWFTPNPDGITTSLTNYTGTATTVEIPGMDSGKLVTIIGEDVFRDRTDITSVTIPLSVTRIKAGAFRGTGITSILIPDNVTHIESSAFRSSRLTSVIIPDSVVVLDSDVFFGCSYLTSVTLSNNITGIGRATFENCVNLTSVTFPDNNNFKSIQPRAFYNCTKLTSVTIPTSVVLIQDNAFFNCRISVFDLSLNTLSFSASAFERDQTINPEVIVYYKPGTTIPANSTNVKYVSLTYQTLTKYGNAPFSITMTATENNTNPITYTSSNDNIAVVTNGQVTPQAAGTVTLTAIQDASSTVSGKIVEISLTVDALEFNTLTYTPLLKYVNETFTPQPIGQNNTEPIAYTCSDPEIAVVTYGEVNTKKIGTVTLTATQGASITVSGKIVQISLTVTNSYVENVDGTYTLSEYNGTETIVNIDTYQGNPITIIGRNAFKDKGITQVTLPEGLLIIGEGAFQNNNLTGPFLIPKSVTHIGANAFKFAGHFSTQLILPNATIGANAFEGCVFTMTI